MVGQHRDGPTQDRAILIAWLGGWILGCLTMMAAWGLVLLSSWL